MFIAPIAVHTNQCNIRQVPNNYQQNYLGDINNANAVSFSGKAEFSSVKPLNFDTLTSETLKKLSSIHFEPSGSGPKGSYSTFVFDNLRNEPQECFVIRDKTGDYDPPYVNRRWEFWVRDPDTNIFNCIGDRHFGIAHGYSHLITYGNMHNYSKGRYSGVGIRGHQFAYEFKMLAKKDNVEIRSYLTAYEFHKKCGFVPISGVLLKDNDYSDFVEEWAYEMELENTDIIPLLERKLINSKWYIDKNLSIRNIVEYMIKCGKEITSSETFFMELSPNAMLDWELFAKSQPIMFHKKPL